MIGPKPPTEMQRRTQGGADAVRPPPLGGCGAPWSEPGPQIKSKRGPLEAWGPLELDGAPDEEPMGP